MKKGMHEMTTLGIVTFGFSCFALGLSIATFIASLSAG